MEEIENQIPRPQIKVLYNNKDITNDISIDCLSLNYKDNTEGSSDSLDIEVMDDKGLWRDEWYPDKGADLTVSIGFNGVLLDCGVFNIDQITLRGAPDTVTLSGLGAGVNGDVRTKVNVAHENKTIEQLVKSIAQKHGFSIVAAEGTDLATFSGIVIQRRTQRDETDLHFLRELGHEFGFLFSLRGKQMVFMDIMSAESVGPVTEIDRSELISYDITDKTLQTYSEVKVAYHNPTTKAVAKSDYKVVSESNNDNVPFKFIYATDIKTINTKAENNQQAERKAKTALYRANSLQQEGTIVVPGNPYLVAGNNFNLTGLGKLSGTYHIMSSSHSVTRSGGWTTSLEIKRVGFVVREKQKSKKKKKEPKYTVTVVK